MLVTTPELADPTTPSGLLVWALALAVLAVIVFIVGLIVRFAVKVMPTLRKLGHLVDDIAGEPERPGVPARLGLMERMETLETGMESIQRQVTPNHGSSMNDWVRDIGGRLDDHIKESEPIKRQVADLHAQWSKETP